VVLIWRGVPLWNRKKKKKKKFFFSVQEDKVEFRLEERKKVFVGYVFLGVQCSVWLVDTVEEVLKSLGKEDFVKSYCEVEKVLMSVGVVIRLAGETKSLQLSKVEDPSKVVSMNTIVKQTSLVRGFLCRGFLNWSMQPTLSRLKYWSRRHRLLLLRMLGWKGLLHFWVVEALLTLKRIRILG
jgi:hypothetical protein